MAENINVPKWRHGDCGQTDAEWKIGTDGGRAKGEKFATAEFAGGEIISGLPSFLPSTAVDMDWRDRVGGGVVIMIRGITLLGRLAVD